MVFIVECPWEWSVYFVQAKYILWLKALWKESQRDLWHLWLLIWKKRWGSRFDDDFLPLCVHKLMDRHCSQKIVCHSTCYFSLCIFVSFCRLLLLHHCSFPPPLLSSSKYCLINSLTHHLKNYNCIYFKLYNLTKIPVQLDRPSLWNLVKCAPFSPSAVSVNMYYPYMHVGDIPWEACFNVVS